MGVETSKRLMSLDALKGFDMFWILLPTYPIFHALLVALGLGGCWLDRQMTHMPWNGFTFYDTIYPLFLFMSGVGFSYSYASSRRRGVARWRIVLGLLKRAVILVLLGSTIFGSLKFDPKTFTLFSVIGRIGISCGIAGCLCIFLPCFRLRLVALVAILVSYAAIPFFVACPGVSEAVLPYAAKETCLYAWMDGNVFPRPLFFEGFAGVFSMVGTAMMGVMAGDWLQLDGITACRRTWGLVISAVLLLFMGLAMAFCLGPYSVPINKPIWSSSYALVSGAYSFGMLALFYWMVDVRGWRSWTFPFRVIGMNLLFAYLASRTIFPFRWEMSFLFGGVSRLMPTPAWGEFAGQLGYFVVYWFILYALYRRGWFFKV